VKEFSKLNLKCGFIPVINGATGKVIKEHKQYGNNTSKAFNGFSTKKQLY